MDTFPVAPELLHAFPLGALSLLVTMASTVAAQHGVERARSICGELASNDELWRFIARRVERRSTIVDDGTGAETLDELSAAPDDSGLREAATSEDSAEATAVFDQNDATTVDVASAPGPQAAEATSVPQDGPPRERPSKSKRRRRQRADGASR
jgi:hypothetical protein